MLKKVLFLLVFGVCYLANGQEIAHNHSLHHSFIENKGQWKDEVLFFKKIKGGNLWVQQNKLMFHLQDFSELQENHGHKHLKGKEQIVSKQDLIHLNFLGSNTVDKTINELESKEYYNYFLGNDTTKWSANVHGYLETTLPDFYDGIDFKLIEQEDHIKYEFYVKPNIDPSQIKLEYKNQKGIKIDRKGRLIISTKLGDIIEEKPYVYQIKNGKIIEIECAYKIDNGIVSFNLGTYNPNYELVIDPVLVFATFCGSSTDNFGMTATYGYDGTAYSAGVVFGNNYPTPDPNAYNTTSNFTMNVLGSPTTDAFISKYSEDGTTMLWTTFLGGGDDTQGTETAHSLICDKQNNIYLYGVTSSLDFPIQNGVQNTHGGGTSLNFPQNGTNFGDVGTDIFVAKVSENGQNLLGSTYVGGSENDGVNYNSVLSFDSLVINYGDQFRGEIMLDVNNNVLVASSTRSTDFPTQSPFQQANGGNQDGVIFKLSEDFSSFLFSSYIGGSENDACYSVKIDSSYNIVFAGGTSSSDFPNTVNGYNASYLGGIADGFVGKLSSDGLTNIQNTYLGATDYDQAFFVEIDRLDNVFVVGQSNGGFFPVEPDVYSNPGSAQFLIKLEPNLQSVIKSTVFGSGNSTFDISPSAFLVDVCGNVYVSGWGASILQDTPMSPMPVTPDAFQSTSPNGYDFYLIVLESEFSDLLYGSYMGGPNSNEHVDGGTSRFDKNGVVYQSVCAGCGGNSDFPTTAGAWSAQNLATNCNNLVFKFDFELIPKAEFTIDDNTGCSPFKVTFDNLSTQGDAFVWDFGNGNLNSTTFEPVVTYQNPGVYEVFLYVTDSVCLITDTASIIIEVEPPLILDQISDISLCSAQEITLTGNSFGMATQFIWSSNSNFSDTLNEDIQDSVLTNFSTENEVYYLMASNQFCSEIDSVEVNFTSAAIDVVGNINLCLGETANVEVVSNDENLTLSNFTWFPDSILTGVNNLSTASFTPTVSQYVYVNLDVSNGCIITDSVMLNVSFINDTTVSATASDYNVPAGNTVTLSALPSGYQYNWMPNDIIDNVNNQIVEATINQTSLFTVSISDGICTREDTVLVKAFTFVCDEPFVFIPNSFSPNGDGENDVLFVRSSIISELTYKIFTRWGELIFESNSINRGWDGTFRGKLMDPDTYDYYIKAVCIDGQEEIIKGNVTLIR